MSGVVFAQSLAEYGGLSSIAEGMRQTWSRIVDRAANVDPTTWVILAGVVLLVLVLGGRARAR